MEQIHAVEGFVPPQQDHGGGTVEQSKMRKKKREKEREEKEEEKKREEKEKRKRKRKRKRREEEKKRKDSHQCGLFFSVLFKLLLLVVFFSLVSC